jgi:hypothetical protein
MVSLKYWSIIDLNRPSRLLFISKTLGESDEGKTIG